MNNVTVTKKGRKPISDQPMTANQRQSRARSLNMKKLSDSNEKEISTSGLIALLPKLISDGHKGLVKIVCKEISKRMVE